MKLKIGVGAAFLLLVVAQIIYTVKTGREASAAKKAAEALAAVSFPPRPAPAEVAEIVFSAPDGAAPVRLARSGGGWTIKSLYDSPAEKGKVERFLDGLLKGGATLVAPADGGAPPAAGLGEGEGVAVALKRLDGGDLRDMIVGLRPEGDYQSVYVKAPGDARIFLLAADLRGEMGLWRNAPDAAPEGEAWLERRVLSFKPETVTALDAVFPDHQILFDREEGGGWRFFGIAPGGRWRDDGVREWIRDLSGFRIAGAGDPATRSAVGLDNPTHRLTLTLEGGAQKSLSLVPDHADGGMWVESSDYPGRVFFLPDWRFKFYFQRMTSLFPDAVPVFPPGGARFMDFRRGGESLKLARREGEWRAVAVPHPVHPDYVERLSRLLADWRPEDYASLGDKAMRPAHGGPLLELTFSDGDVFQFRLGGRHPVFPWRYVLLNGGILLSIRDREAGVLFPDFSEILILPDADDEEQAEPAPAPDGGEPAEKPAEEAANGET